MIQETISQTWPWYVAGPLIAVIMFLLLWFGQNFGVSSTLRTMCTIGGAAKWSDFFNIDWHAQKWNLVFIGGAILGGFIAHTFFPNPEGVSISQNTIQELKQLGIENPGQAFLPASIFSWEGLLTLKGLILLVLGGFLVGFGARYAGGCTSGHAISGLSNLQLPSLIAVIGFFIGGLLVTHLLLPYIFNV